MKATIFKLVIGLAVAIAASSPVTAGQSGPSRSQPPSPMSVVPLLPDLVVTFFTQEGPAQVAGDHVEVRVSLGAKNQGSAPAGKFKVAVECTVEPAPKSPRGGFPAGPFIVPFSGDGPTVEWYAYTSGPLAPGGNWYFKRKVIFPPTVRGVRVTLQAIADSCAGDELMPDYCRVKESNEGNNRSAAIEVTLP